MTARPLTDEKDINTYRLVCDHSEGGVCNGRSGRGAVWLIKSMPLSDYYKSNSEYLKTEFNFKSKIEL